jgi:hypothetical protein
MFEKRLSAKEVQVMKKLVLAMAVLALTATVAFAGPNANNSLTVHGNVDGLPTTGDPCTDIPIPQLCEDTQPVAQPNVDGVEWFVVLAAGANPLAFNTVTFGVGTYDSGACYIGLYGPCSADLNPLEIPSGGWPGPNSGTSVSWSPNCLTGMLVPIYYFGVYAYAPGTIPLGDEYPGQTAAFVSCDSPPEEDAIERFGSFGCGGGQGVRECPTGPPPTGACCIGPDCFMLTEEDCLGQGGEFIGGPCDPNPCEPPPADGACCIDTNGDGNNETCIITSADDCAARDGDYQGDGTVCADDTCPPDPPIATQQSTWGQIKSIYR